MAIPNRQIGWSTKSNLLWQISKQLERLTAVTSKHTTTTTTTLSTTTTTTTTVPVDVTISLIAPNSNGVVELYVNGTLAETQINLGSKTVTINSGDTFYIIFDNSFEYDGIQWVLTNNAVFVAQGSGTVNQLISPTYTALPGGDYLFACNGYST
jgi:hypothetical protein